MVQFLCSINYCIHNSRACVVKMSALRYQNKSKCVRNETGAAAESRNSSQHLGSSHGKKKEKKHVHGPRSLSGALHFSFVVNKSLSREGDRGGDRNFSVVESNRQNEQMRTCSPCESSGWRQEKVSGMMLGRFFPKQFAF